MEGRRSVGIEKLYTKDLPYGRILDDDISSKSTSSPRPLQLIRVGYEQFMLDSHKVISLSNCYETLSLNC